MGWSKSCRLVRCMRPRPPRPVHGEQRLLQRSVTTAVMQITDYATVISVLDFSVPSVTRTAFRTGSTACRVGAPDQRTHGGPRATWTGLVASVSGVTNGRSRAACGSVRRPWNAVVAHCRTDPGRCGGRARGGGTDRDGTVITLKRQSRHPRASTGGMSGNLLVDRRSCSGSGTRRRPGTTSAPAAGTRRCHQFQLRTMRSLPVVGSGPVRSSKRVTSSSCALPFLPLEGPLRCRRAHQFQLRTAVPSCCGRFVVSAFTGSGCAPRRPSARWAGGSGSPVPVAHRCLLFWVVSSGKRAGRTSWRFGTTSRGRRHASTAPAWAGRVRRLPRYG